MACIFTWYWLAALCARAGIPFVLGHALDMQAMHGGKANNDTSAAQNIAVLRRGGMLPQASVSPAEMRAPRAWLRRRVHLTRQRAALLAHSQQTTRQYNLPEIGQQIASTANRDGGAARFPAPAVPQSIAVALALLAHEDTRRRAVAWTSVPTAKQPAAPTWYRLPSVPGLGKIWRWVLRYELHDRSRVPRVQDFVSSCRLVQCAKESAGQRSGTSGTQIGKAYLKWAFSAAAGRFRRNHPVGQT